MKVKNWIFSVVIVLVMVVGLSLSAVTAHALIVIDFETGGGGNGGSITKVGNIVTGTNIPINLVTITGAPMNNGSFDVDGPLSCASGTDTCGDLDFSVDLANLPGGTLTIVGSIPGLGISQQTLLSGSFTDAMVFNNIFAGNGPDTKSEDLLEAIGASGTAFKFGQTEIVVGGNIGTTARTVSSTDVSNESVPEPASLLLLGSGLTGLGLAAWGRKRFRG